MISRGWPSFVTKEIKKWHGVFHLEKDKVTLNLDKSDLMWGISQENGECDEDLREDMGGCYEWEQEIKYLSELMKDSDNDMAKFFSGIGVKVSLNGALVSFELN